MSSPYPVLDDRPIDEWRVTELKEELKRRNLATKGLKEELVKRLSKALLPEFNTNEDEENEPDSLPKSDLQFEDEKRPEIVNDVVASKPEVLSEEDKSESLVSGTAESAMESGANTIQMENINSKKEDEGVGSVVDENGAKENVASSVSSEDKLQAENLIQEPIVVNKEDAVEEELVGSIVDGKDAKENVASSVSSDDKLQAENLIQEPIVVNKEDAVVEEDFAVVASVSQLDSNHGISHDENPYLKPDLENESILETKSEVDKPVSPHANDAESRLAHLNSLTISSGPDNQVSEISLAVGIQVKSDFSTTESGSINEKSDVKNNIISDMKMQVVVKPEMVQLSSCTASLDNMESDPVDLEVVHEKKPFIEEKDGDIAKPVDFIKNEDSGDTGSPEKLNLDRNSGDDSMEEDALESEHNFDSDLLGPKLSNMEPSLRSEKSNVVGDVDMSLDAKVTEGENEKSYVAASLKRKLHDQSAVENKDIAKRNRTQPDSLKLPREHSVNNVAFTRRDDAMHPNVGGGFSKPKSADNESPKERVVPPSAKSPTNSLRIDRFLRPFTIKAVHDLLGRTGTVLSFWMDTIKTHCFVTYSSIEEATETRNAVYNLQWPTNGGHLLIADFVDPQEVKVRVEGPLPSPMTPSTPVGPRLNFPSAQPAGPPQPLPRQQVLRQQLPPQPPLLSNPLAAREKVMPLKKQMAPVQEQLLPPPPPISEKVDRPALTLDDLFRKTTAPPRIYYQPLSDEQVAAKLNLQGNKMKQ